MTDPVKPGDSARLMAPGAMRGILVTVDEPVSATRFRIIAREGMWNGKPFTAAADYLERVQ